MKVKGKPIPPKSGFYYPDITKTEVAEAGESPTEREEENVKMVLNICRLLKKPKIEEDCGA